MKDWKLRFELFICFVVGFYLLYTPDLSLILKPLKPSVLVCSLALLNLLILNRRFLDELRTSRLWVIAASYLLATGYLLLIILIRNGQFNSMISNITGIAQIINIIALAIYLKQLELDYRQMWCFLILEGLVQALICIAMLLVPKFKVVANLLFTMRMDYTGDYEYLLRNRVYGISSNYTFLLPTLLALLAFLAVLYAFSFKKAVYYVYACLMLFAAYLNGRTGLYVFAAVIGATMLYYLVVGYHRKRIFILAAVLALGVTGMLCILFRWDPYKFNGFIAGIKSCLSIFSGEKQGTLSVLSGRMFFLPENGRDIVFGLGHRVFGELGDSTIGKNSDLGYINDLFKGGLVYLSLLYLPQLYLAGRTLFNKYKVIDKPMLNALMVGIMAFFLIISYKGECMTGSCLNLAAVFLYMSISKHEIKGAVDEG